MVSSEHNGAYISPPICTNSCSIVLSRCANLSHNFTNLVFVTSSLLSSIPITFQAGFVSALPYLVMAITIQASGQLADWVRRKRILSTTSVRKLFNSFGKCPGW